MLVARHGAVPRLHGDAASLFRFPCQTAIPPALLAANILVILLWVAVTFVFGRIYCSVICPLGVMQDIVSYFSGKQKNSSTVFPIRPKRNC